MNVRAVQELLLTTDTSQSFLATTREKMGLWSPFLTPCMTQSATSEKVSFLISYIYEISGSSPFHGRVLKIY